MHIDRTFSTTLLRFCRMNKKAFHVELIAFVRCFARFFFSLSWLDAVRTHTHTHKNMAAVCEIISRHYLSQLHGIICARALYNICVYEMAWYFGIHTYTPPPSAAHRQMTLAMRVSTAWRWKILNDESIPIDNVYADTYYALHIIMIEESGFSLRNMNVYTTTKRRTIRYVCWHAHASEQNGNTIDSLDGMSSR